jgi:hypothetical protein
MNNTKVDNEHGHMGNSQHLPAFERLVELSTPTTLMKVMKISETVNH